MAYRRGSQQAVSGFIRAGYRENELFQDEERAGSARDSLRDLNRTGYRNNPDGPDPYYFDQKQDKTEKKKKQTGIFEKIRLEIRADKQGAAVCAFFFAVVLVLMFALLSEISDSSSKRAEISDYTHRTNALVQANETLQEQLTRLTSEDRIHNLAQNTYGMLRRERAETNEIYVVMPEKDGSQEKNTDQKPKVEIMDILLGLMDRFHIGG